MFHTLLPINYQQKFVIKFYIKMEKKHALKAEPITKHSFYIEFMYRLSIPYTRVVSPAEKQNLFAIPSSSSECIHVCTENTNRSLNRKIPNMMIYERVSFCYSSQQFLHCMFENSVINSVKIK